MKTSLPIKFVSKGWGFEKWKRQNDQPPKKAKPDQRVLPDHLQNLQADGEKIPLPSEPLCLEEVERAAGLLDHADALGLAIQDRLDRLVVFIIVRAHPWHVQFRPHK